MKTNLLQTLISTITILILGACTGPNSVNTEQQIIAQQNEQQRQELLAELEERYESADKPVQIGWYDTEEALDQFQFDCQDCPESTGQLVAIDRFETIGPQVFIYPSNCQGGLIAEDLFLTNRHCIPLELQSQGAACEERIKIVFPKVSTAEAEVVSCQEVVSLQLLHPDLEVKDIQPDWAILKLKKSLPERYSQTSTEGVANNEKYYLHVPLKNEETQEISMNSIECRSIQDSVRVPEFNNDLAPVTFMKCDKDLVKGMSGSLIFDGPEPDAKVVMTLSHIVNPRLDDDQAPVSRYAIATNFACVSTSLGSELPETCAFDPSQNQHLRQQVFGKAIEQAHEQSSSLLENFIEEEGRGIQWQRMEPESIDGLQGVYNDYFQNRVLAFQTDTMNESQKFAYFQSLSPFYAQCISEPFTDVRSVPQLIPQIHYQILKTEDGTLDAQVELFRRQGQIYFNDTQNLYAIRFTEQFENPEVAENFYFRSSFHHSATLPACD